MTTFTLDTSGTVLMPAGNLHFSGLQEHVGWSHLSPFAQGYIEAAWEAVRELRRDAEDALQMNLEDLGFRHLAPEALARIRRDCAAWKRAKAQQNPACTSEQGATFWRERNASESRFASEPNHEVWRILMYGFPPLTPYLGDDGKVYLREGTS